MKIISLILIIAGIGLAFWGFQISGSFGSKLTHAISGSYTDKVMTLYIGSAVSLIVGIYLFLKR
jgi:hypothetical protein